MAWVHRRQLRRQLPWLFVDGKMNHSPSLLPWPLSCPALQRFLKQHLLAKWERERSIWQNDTLPFLCHSASPTQTVREWALASWGTNPQQAVLPMKPQPWLRQNIPRSLVDQSSPPDSTRSAVSSFPLAFKDSLGYKDVSFMMGEQRQEESEMYKNTKNTKRAVSLWVGVRVSELVHPKFKPVIHFCIWKQLGHPCHIVMRIQGIAVFDALDIL